MVGVSNLKNYLEARDKNGSRVGDWALQSGKGKAKCRFCNITVSYAAGKKGLHQHSESQKHKKAAEAASLSKQVSVGEMFKAKEAEDTDRENEAVKQRARKLEIQLVGALSRHQIPYEFVDCLVPILKNNLHDCPTVQEIRLGREKARYIATDGIAPIFRDENIRKLQECDGFVIGFDETAINKKEELEIMAKLATPGEGVEMIHYCALDLEAGDAATITDTIFEKLEEDKIEYEKTMLGASTDWCNVMGGVKTGVVTRMEEMVPELLRTGGCNAHHVSNAIQAMVNLFDPDLKDALVNLSECVGGHKGRSLKQMNAYQKIAVEEVGLKPLKIRKFVPTRWRSIRHCAQDALKQEDAIFAYLKQVKKPTERQKKLQRYFVEQREMTQLKLRFVVSATREFDGAIDYFEANGEHAHEVHGKLHQILSSQLMKVMKEEEVKRVDEEENLILKNPLDLLSTDLEDSKKQKKDTGLFIGESTEKFMKTLGLDPKSLQLKWFFESARKAHLIACQRLIKYFKTSLESKELNYMSALAPLNRKKLNTARRIKYLARRFSKILRRIDSVGGQDRLEEEVQRYVGDEDIIGGLNEPYGDYWLSVGTVTEGAAGWSRYTILPRFAVAMGTFFNSAGANERMFSILGVYGDDKSKNRLEQETMDAMLQIRDGIESKKARSICTKCLENSLNPDPRANPHPHCHCMLFEVTDQVLNSCRSSWRRLQSKRLEVRAITEIEEGRMNIASEKFKETEKKRVEEFKRKLSKRSTILPPSSMLRVYEGVNKNVTAARTKAVTEIAGGSSFTAALKTAAFPKTAAATSKTVAVPKTVAAVSKTVTVTKTAPAASKTVAVPKTAAAVSKTVSVAVPKTAAAASKATSAPQTGTSLKRKRKEPVKAKK